MKKLMICAAFVAAMCALPTVNAQEVKKETKKECTTKKGECPKEKKECSKESKESKECHKEEKGVKGGCKKEAAKK